MNEMDEMDEKRFEIKRLCKKLYLSNEFVENFAYVSTETQDNILRLFKSEEIHRLETKKMKCLNGANFPCMYAKEDFETKDINFSLGASFDALLNLNFYDEKRNVIMYGNTGTGKTMLSVLIGIEACKKGIPVKFYRTTQLVNLLAEARANGTLSKLRKRLDSAQILILDEFGYVPYDLTGCQLLFDYLSEIHEVKPVILNTNVEFSKWVSVLHDEKMTKALIGRLLQHAHILRFYGSNNRLAEVNAILRQMERKS